MFRLFLILMFFWAAFPTSVKAQPQTQEAANTAFFQDLNDIPLMPGLREILNESTLFDKPEGRIGAGAALSDFQSVSAIRSFYRKTLPQLGWMQGAGDSFTREGEKLDLEVMNVEGTSILRLKLGPAGALPKQPEAH